MLLESNKVSVRSFVILPTGSKKLCLLFFFKLISWLLFGLRNSLFSFNRSLICSLCTILLLKPAINLYEHVWRSIVFLVLNFLVLNWLFIKYYISLLTLFFFAETLNHLFHLCSQLLVEHFCDGFLKTMLDNSKFLLSRFWVFFIQVVSSVSQFSHSVMSNSLQSHEL